MNLLDTLRRFLHLEAPRPSTLRNKAGGMVWIKCPNRGDGTEVLNGRAVKTVRESAGFWTIDPQQEFVLRVFALADDGRIGMPGDVAIAFELHDDILEPWKDTGLTASEVADLYAPKLPEVAHV